jgi:hypothetical protein
MAQTRFKELRRAHAPIRVEKIILDQEPFLAFCRGTITNTLQVQSF